MFPISHPTASSLNIYIHTEKILNKERMEMKQESQWKLCKSV